MGPLVGMFPFKGCKGAYDFEREIRADSCF